MRSHDLLSVFFVAWISFWYPCSSLEVDRRCFGTHLLSLATIDTGRKSLLDALNADSLQWQDNRPVQWSNLRYGSSSLESSKVPNASKSATFFPRWLSGYWLAKYKLIGVKFPQGRDKISLRVAGAGLATCLSLPNVGANPPEHVWKFVQDSDHCHEDWAYNLPRRLEAFCPGTRVTAIQTGIPSDSLLSPKCFVTGEGCLAGENPRLHDQATRVVMEFQGPTRRGPVQQTMDVTMLSSDYSALDDKRFVSDRSFAQFNVQQDLQTFYREILSLEAVDDKTVDGRIRVAGFLPGDSSSTYDDQSALVLYDYKIMLQSIDEEEAKQI